MSVRHECESKEFVRVREDSCRCEGWEQRGTVHWVRAHCLMLAWVFPTPDKGDRRAIPSESDKTRSTMMTRADVRY